MQKSLFHVIVKLQNAQGHNIDSNLSHPHCTIFFKFTKCFLSFLKFQISGLQNRSLKKMYQFK